jgi:hypothetical protein
MKLTRRSLLGALSALPFIRKLPEPEPDNPFLAIPPGERAMWEEAVDAEVRDFYDHVLREHYALALADLQAREDLLD